MTPADLARLIADSRQYRRGKPTQLMPSATADVSKRVSAFDFARRLRRRGIETTEEEARANLNALAEAGALRKDEGGYSVCDWKKMNDISNDSR